jgi:hypothetical protein
MARIALSSALFVLVDAAMGGCADGRAADLGTIEPRRSRGGATRKHRRFRPATPATTRLWAGRLFLCVITWRESGDLRQMRSVKGKSCCEHLATPKL